MNKAVYRFAIKELRDKLTTMNKYDFLIKTLPYFDKRPWLQGLTRGDRIPIARFLLSQHRLPIEKGRWWNAPPEKRICPHCQHLPDKCKIECKCGKCIGDEQHYLTECQYTKELWRTTAINKIRPTKHMEDNASVFDAFRNTHDLPAGKNKQIGKAVSVAFRDILTIAEAKPLPQPTEAETK
jgi:hypothetical protein